MMTYETGWLILVVGPSGAGKDSLLDGARAALADDARFAFPVRAITRPAAIGGERHLELSDAEFHEALRDGLLSLHWCAHGCRYGVPKSIETDLIEGRHVVVNVSRGIVAAARARFQRVAVIHVTASTETLIRRLRQRGRDTEAEIAARLHRAGAFGRPVGPNVYSLENENPLSESVSRFVTLLRGIAAEPRPQAVAG